MAAIGIALGMLAILLASIVSQGYTAFAQHDLALEIYFDPAEIDPQGTRDPSTLSGADYAALARQSLQAVFPEVESRTERRRLNSHRQQRRRLRAAPDGDGRSVPDRHPPDRVPRSGERLSTRC